MLRVHVWHDDQLWTMTNNIVHVHKLFCFGDVIKFCYLLFVFISMYSNWICKQFTQARIGDGEIQGSNGQGGPKQGGPMKKIISCNF